MKKILFALPVFFALSAQAQVIVPPQSSDSQGNITATGVANLNILQLNSNEVPLTPGGRLSVSRTAAVPTSDLTAQTTVYYVPYVSSLVPIYTGTHWKEYGFNAVLAFSLGATNMPASEVFDVYAVNVGNVPTLCSMYWGSNTSRSATVGGKTGSANATVTQLNGIWVNAAAIATANCFGGAAGTTSVTIAQNQGTLLGSYYTTGSGSTGVAFKPTAAAGGTNNIIGISNAYNRVYQSAISRESATGVQAASTTFTSWGASVNRVSWVDTLQLSPVTSHVSTVGGNGTAGDCAAVGTVLDATTGTPGVVGQGCSNGTIAQAYTTLAPTETYYPQLGFHFLNTQIAALIGGTATFTPVAGQNGLTVDLQW